MAERSAAQRAVAVLLATLLCSGGAAGLAADPALPRTTSPAIALANLDFTIARQARVLDAVPDDPVALAAWLDALFARVTFLGSYDDLLEAERRTRAALARNPGPVGDDDPGSLLGET